mgnify:CR=1 FL=1
MGHVNLVGEDKEELYKLGRQLKKELNSMGYTL